MTSDISTTENAENGGLGQYHISLYTRGSLRSLFYMYTSHIIKDSANDVREITRTYLR